MGTQNYEDTHFIVGCRCTIWSHDLHPIRFLNWDHACGTLGCMLCVKVQVYSCKVGQEVITHSPVSKGIV